MIWQVGGWCHPHLDPAGGSWGKVSMLTFCYLHFFLYFLQCLGSGILNKQTLKLRCNKATQSNETTQLFKQKTSNARSPCKEKKIYLSLSLPTQHFRNDSIVCPLLCAVIPPTTPNFITEHSNDTGVSRRNHWEWALLDSFHLISWQIEHWQKTNRNPQVLEFVRTKSNFWSDVSGLFNIVWDLAKECCLEVYSPAHEHLGPF